MGRKVPIWGKDNIKGKSYIKKYAIIDEEFYDIVNKYRWTCSRNGVVISKKITNNKCKIVRLIDLICGGKALYKDYKNTLDCRMSNILHGKRIVGKEIYGYEGLYSVTRDGKIWSIINHKFLSSDDTNYKYFDLCKNGTKSRVSGHRMVAMTYIPNPNNLPQVHHKDSNRYNNNVENLEWITIQDNIHHSYKFMSQVRNFKKCVLVINGKYNKIFKSAISCSKYCHEKFNLSTTGMQKYKSSRDGKYKIFPISKLRFNAIKKLVV